MELWTAPTPNGWKVNIMLEELVEAGVDLPEIKMADWEDNGDFFSTVLYDDEYQSMQIENKEIIAINSKKKTKSLF